jgi:hypothetical protein
VEKPGNLCEIAAFSYEKPVEKSVHIVENMLFSTRSLLHYQHLSIEENRYHEQKL